MNDEDKLKIALKGRVAISIDAANLEQSIKEIEVFPPTHIRPGMMWKKEDYKWRVNYKNLYQYFKSNSQLSWIKFYSARFDTETHNGFLTVLKNLGYELYTKPVKTIDEKTIDRKCIYCGEWKRFVPVFKCDECKKENLSSNLRKADVDVEISVDAVARLEEYDTLVIFSGDSDFQYLIEYLRKRNKEIIIISHRNHIAKEIRTDSCLSLYIDVVKMMKEWLEVVKKPLKMPKPLK